MVPFLFVAVVNLGQVAPPLPQLPPFPGQSASTINIVQWEGKDLPKPIQRSEQPPLSDDEVSRLSKEGFEAPQLVKIIEERRCACDVSADGLVRLKRAGVHKDVLAAMSLHALKPNRSIQLEATVDFSGDGRTARQAYLYFFIADGEVTRVFTVNIDDVLQRPFASEQLVDRSDIIIAKRVRRIRFSGEVPLKTYGDHTVLVASSGNPSLTHPSQLSELERKTSQVYQFQYPRASLLQQCRLTAGYKRDAVLADKWKYMGARFECEWN